MSFEGWILSSVALSLHAYTSWLIRTDLKSDIRSKNSAVTWTGWSRRVPGNCRNWSTANGFPEYDIHASGDEHDGAPSDGRVARSLGIEQWRSRVLCGGKGRASSERVGMCGSVSTNPFIFVSSQTSVSAKERIRKGQTFGGWPTCESQA